MLDSTNALSHLDVDEEVTNPGNECLCNVREKSVLGYFSIFNLFLIYF